MNSKRSWIIPGTSLLFFSASLVFRYLSFIQTPYANGWDGYFYINQVKSFMQEGKMDVPDLSLIYPLMMLVQFFTNDYVLSYKLLAGILAGAFMMSLFLLAMKTTNNYRIALVLACVSLFSPHLTYFAAQYPKNLLGVICFMWLIYVADSKNKIIPVLLLALNFFGHRVTAVLGFGFLTINLLMQKATRLVPYVLILFIILFVAGGFFLPGILNLFDAERFHGLISAQPQFAPYSFVSSFGRSLIPAWWLIEIVACCIVFFAAFAYATLRRDHDVWLTILLMILSFLIFPFFRWTMDGPAVRFTLIFILLCPLLLMFLLRSIDRKYILEGVSLLLVVCSFFSYKSYDPGKHDPPYKLYSIAGREILSKVPADSCDLIIAHKSLAEYMVYSTGIDAMSWVPEYDIENTRLWRVAEGVKDIQFSFYLDPGDLAFVHRLTPSYSLVREDRWKKFIRLVKKDGNEELLQQITTWKNPDRVRPYFMLKNKPG